MKLLTILTVSIIAIISSYIGVDRSLSIGPNVNKSHDKTDTVVATQCPDDSSIISRNLREEGIVSKIKAQSDNRARVAEIKNYPN